MIQITLHNTGPVQEPAYKKMYELVVEFMHGDADGTTYHTVFYEDDGDEEYNEMLVDILGLIHASKADSLDDAMEDLPEIFESQGIEDAHARADSFRDSFYEGDITCEGRSAAIADIEMFYWDDKGVKHGVAIKVNGFEI